MKNQALNQSAWPVPIRASLTDVFCDFDGTITGVDATDAVLETFALPAWREWEERWVNSDHF